MQKLVLRQLNRRLGTLEPSLLQRVSELPLEQLEALGEDLLDFTEISDARELVQSTWRHIATIKVIQLLLARAENIEKLHCERDRTQRLQETEERFWIFFLGI